MTVMFRIFKDKDFIAQVTGRRKRPSRHTRSVRHPQTAVFVHRHRKSDSGHRVRLAPRVTLNPGGAVILASASAGGVGYGLIFGALNGCGKLACPPPPSPGRSRAARAAVRRVANTGSRLQISRASLVVATIERVVVFLKPPPGFPNHEVRQAGQEAGTGNMKNFPANPGSLARPTDVPGPPYLLLPRPETFGFRLNTVP